MRAIMIMFDTLSRNYLSNYGNAKEDTPNFQRLAKKMTTFDQFYGGSMPCMPARRELHTGRYNFMHRMWGQLEPFDHSIFEIMQKNNIYCHLVTDHSHYFEDGGATYHNRYSTWQGFRGQEGDRWLPRKLGENLNNTNVLNKTGISVKQHFSNRTKQLTEETMSSTKTVKAGLEFLETYHTEDDWFLQIECFDPHEPFYIPSKEQGHAYFWPKYGRVTDEITENDLAELKQEYKTLLKICDKNLGKLLDYIDKNNMWKDTLIIVNTDHGILLGEHGWLGKNVAPMYEEVIHLPFFISSPNSIKGNRCKVLSQTIDIPATLLDYFGIKNDLEMDGKSLLPILKKSSETLHTEVIFGTNGGHVNIYDGRYVYMRASIYPDNGPITNQTLNYSAMRGFLKKDILDKIALKSGNRFTNQYPYTEIPVKTYIDSYSIGHLLFDLKKDPEQLSPIKNKEIEERMIKKLIKIMNQIEAPDSEYRRLGLTKELKS